MISHENLWNTPFSSRLTMITKFCCIAYISMYDVWIMSLHSIVLEYNYISSITKKAYEATISYTSMHGGLLLVNSRLILIYAKSCCGNPEREHCGITWYPPSLTVDIATIMSLWTLWCIILCETFISYLAVQKLNWKKPKT